jgi:hypothetical protein
LSHDFNWGGVLIALAIIVAMFAVPVISFMYDEWRKKRATVEATVDESASAPESPQTSVGVTSSRS